MQVLLLNQNFTDSIVIFIKPTYFSLRNSKIIFKSFQMQIVD